MRRALTFTCLMLLLGCERDLTLGAQRVPSGPWTPVVQSLWRNYPRTTLEPGEEDGYAGIPDVTVAADSSIWVLWPEVDSRTDCAPCQIRGHVAHWRDGAAELLPALEGPKSPAQVGMPTKLALDSNGNPWVALKRPIAGNGFVELLRWSASAWERVGTTENTPSESTDGESPGLVVQGESATLAWAESHSGVSTLHVDAFQKGARTHLETGLPTELSSGASCPTLVTDGAGRVTAAWLLNGQRIVVASRVVGTGVWTKRLDVTASDEAPVSCPSLATTDRAGPLVAWREGTGRSGQGASLVVADLSAGTSTSRIEILPSDVRLAVSVPRVKLSSDGTPVIAFETTSRLDSVRSTVVPSVMRWDGRTWKDWGEALPALTIPASWLNARPALTLGLEDAPVLGVNERPSDFFSVRIETLPLRLP